MHIIAKSYYNLNKIPHRAVAAGRLLPLLAVSATTFMRLPFQKMQKNLYIFCRSRGICTIPGTKSWKFYSVKFQRARRIYSFIKSKFFARTFAAFVKALRSKKGIEKNLLAQKFIKSIKYCKESIQLNLFSRQRRTGFPQLPKEKFRSEGAENPFNSVLTNYTIGQFFMRLFAWYRHHQAKTQRMAFGD